MCGSETLTNVWPESMGIHKSRKGQASWLPPLEISRDSNKLPCLAGSANIMGTQAYGGGHVIGTCDQLKGVSVNILCSHAYPLHLVYMCAPTQACTCTIHTQGQICMHRCTNMLFLFLSFIFFPIFISVLPYLFLSFAHSFSRKSSLLSYISPSLCYQP